MTRACSHFRPALGLRSGHVQSLVSSSALRRGHARKVSRELRAAEQVITLDGGDGIRLQGMLSRQPAGRGKGG